MTPWVSDGETTPHPAGCETQELPEDLSQLPRPASGTAASARTVSYLGYKFFKADPIPGEEATWTKVERMEMEATQSELSKKVQKRANKVSAAQQYQLLSEILQAHVNQLIHEQRQLHPQGDWSCVYAKERQKASKARNALRDDYEVVSMQVILMKRPLQTKSYPRTPMGELVDLGPQFGTGLNRPKRVNSENIYHASEYPLYLHMASFKRPSSAAYHWLRHRPGRPSGTAVELEGVAPDFSRPLTADGDLRRRNPDGSGKLEATDEPRGLKRSRSHQENIESDEEWNTIDFDTQSEKEDITSHTGSPSESSLGRASPSLRCTCQDHCSTPASLTSLEDMDDQTPYLPSRYRRQDDVVFSDMEARNSGGESPCSTVDTVQPRSAPPTKRPRLSASHNLSPHQWEKKLYVQSIQSMNEEELRIRLLDCEARIERWEKTFHRQTQMLRMRVSQRPGPHGY